MKQILILFFLLLNLSLVFSQFTQTDSIRGNYGEARNWWDLKHYDLQVDFDLDNHTIEGSNLFTFQNLEIDSNRQIAREFQIDLQKPMQLDGVYFLNETGEKFQVQWTDISRKGEAYFVKLPCLWTEQNSALQVFVYFHGKPKEAVKPPWDGGFVWSEDKEGKPWVTVACQGIGASVWFPCKDSQVDKPDSVSMTYTVPSDLVCVSNGRLVKKVAENAKKTRYTWKVNNPINSYCMIPYIGDYSKLESKYVGLNGELELEYWVLKGNEITAKSHFDQIVPKTLEAFEHWFGPYPFYSDGYKMVEAPHLGMEHQSAIAYGNGFKNGYKETDLSGTGIGLNWDFIVVHETAHEWFGNSITSKDVADMWIHEAFATYAEVLFIEYWYGKEQATDYCIGIRKNIQNDIPIIGSYGVHNEGSTDMYYKGANMLHTIRQLTGNDSLFHYFLLEMNRTFFHQVTTSEEIESLMCTFLNLDLNTVFDQYLRTTLIPTLHLKKKKSGIKYRWENCIPGFEMEINISGKSHACSEKWRFMERMDEILPEVNRAMYVNVK